MAVAKVSVLERGDCKKMSTWNVIEVCRWVKVVPEPVERIDSGIHIKLRREFKQGSLSGTSLHRR